MAVRHSLTDDDRNMLLALHRAVWKSELISSYMAYEVETEEQHERFFELLEMMAKAEAIVVPEKKTGG